MDTALQDPLVGHLVDGRYQVESRIARGGMATVYRALDRRLGRDVALKVMLPHLAGDPEFLARFVREARAAARLSHPNVVQVFDQGSDGDTLYLAMEYLPGRTLREVLTERGALTVREALTVLDPVLDALAAAHRAGIVHRDVKPENVILTDDGRVKVADFGLARAVSSGTAGPSKGMLLGTVAYVAPELLTRGIADARADVYAAGILLFEMLTGRQPFAGANPVDIARRHVTDAVPAPSTLVPQLPSELDDLVIAATAGDPDERPANAQQMLAMTRAIRAHVPEAALDVRPSVPRSAPDARTQVVASPAPELRQTRAIALRGGSDVAVASRRPAKHDGHRVMVQRRRRGGLALLAVIAAVLLLSGGGWWFLAGPGAYQRTPPLVGDTVTQARQALAVAGLRVSEQPVFSDQVKAGIVVQSFPPGGGRVRKGGRVVIQVSQGPQLISVPDVGGESQDDATKALQQVSLTVGDVQKEFSDTVPAGSVISTTPDAGQKLHRGDQVDLVISKGRDQITVPDVTGQSQDAATQTLTDANLKVRVNTEQDPQTPPGQVISQDPPAGDTAQPGDTVTLQVSAEIPLVPVPDVVDQRFNDARQTLEDAGFQVQRQGLPFFNRVRQQSPGAGQQAPQGSVVILITGP